MPKRIIVLFSVFILMAMGLYLRIFQISNGGYLAMVANNQSSYTLNVYQSRAGIYDRNFNPLVNSENTYRAAVMPCAEAAAELGTVLPEDERASVFEQLKSSRPFLLELGEEGAYAKGIHLFEIQKRYTDKQIAPQIIGYTDATGTQGQAGIEKVFDEFLNQHTKSIDITYQVDGLGSPLQGVIPKITRQGFEDQSGVVLTLDRELQQVCENIAREYIEKGAVVVMDCDTGELLASVSMPEFNPNDLAASLEDEDAPFINRAFSKYSVGSTYKLLVAAAALENGFTPDTTFECKGYVDINGQIFKCHKQSGHGQMDLKHAIEESCNTYFVQLAMELGADPILNLSQAVGFGKADVFAEGYATSEGTLPTAGQIRNPGDLANLSFGQGMLTATPVQIAKLISMIANGGNSVTPKLILGMADKTGLQLSEETPNYAQTRLISEETAQLLQEFMISTVEEGSGSQAKPEKNGAGGKTASAQTGTYFEDGTEKVEAWFSGFYPANNPKYSIVVFVENGQAGAEVAAPIFKKIVDSMQYLQG